MSHEEPMINLNNFNKNIILFKHVFKESTEKHKKRTAESIYNHKYSLLFRLFYSQPFFQCFYYLFTHSLYVHMWLLSSTSFSRKEQKSFLIPFALRVGVRLFFSAAECAGFMRVKIRVQCKYIIYFILYIHMYVCMMPVRVIHVIVVVVVCIFWVRNSQAPSAHHHRNGAVGYIY